MPEKVLKLQSDIAEINDQIAKDAQLLLAHLDINKVLTDPDFLREISLEFVRQHFDDFKKGIAVGDIFVDAVLANKPLQEDLEGG